MYTVIQLFWRGTTERRLFFLSSTHSLHPLDFAPEWQAGKQAWGIHTESKCHTHQALSSLRNHLPFSPLCSHPSRFQSKPLSERASSHPGMLSVHPEFHPYLEAPAPGREAWMELRSGVDAVPGPGPCCCLRGFCGALRKQDVLEANGCPLNMKKYNIGCLLPCSGVETQRCCSVSPLSVV